MQKGVYSGKVGNFIVSSMFPFIGNVGLWIFVFIGLIISLMILLDGADIKIDAKKIVPNFKRVDTSVKPKRIENKRKEKREKRVKKTVNIFRSAF